MRAWHYIASLVTLAAIVIALPPQSESTAVKEDPLIGIARLEERVKALFVLLDERAKQVDVALAAAEKATDKAQGAQDRVNIASNEWRGALDDATTKQATKVDVDRISDRLGAIESGYARRIDVEQVAARVGKLETGAAGGEGRSGGSSATRELMLTILPIALSAVSLLVVLFLAFARRQVPRSPTSG